MNGCMRKIKVRVGESGPRLKVKGTEESLVAGFVTDNGVVKSVFFLVCKRNRAQITNFQSST